MIFLKKTTFGCFAPLVLPGAVTSGLFFGIPAL